MTSAEQRAFYDRFLRARMLAYVAGGNLRVDRATARLLPLVRRDSRVLEIGCGIGLVAARVARKARQGRVWACDLSPENIAFARRAVRARNVDFFVCDVLASFEAVRARIEGGVDLVTLIDALEHIPLSEHATLLRGIGSLLSPGGAILLTYPSPEYQRYLRLHDPAELQPIDEIVQPDHLATVAEDAGLLIVRHELVDVWLTRQYVHCVLRPREPLRPVIPTRGERLLAMVRGAGRGLGRKLRGRAVNQIAP